MPAGLGFLPDGTPLVVSQADRAVYRIVDGHPELHAALGDLAGGMANDMVVAGDGTAYVGNHGFDMAAGEQPRPTTLARVDPDGTVTRAADDCVFPNGSVITPDGKTLLVAESFAHRISAWDIGDGGALSGRRVWAQLDETLTPDGICMDADGGVWAGKPARRQVRAGRGGRRDHRRDPHTGQVGGRMRLRRAGPADAVPPQRRDVDGGPAPGHLDGAHRHDPAGRRRRRHALGRHALGLGRHAGRRAAGPRACAHEE